MARLSSPLEKIKAHYTVVVIGSGYGGGIAASRLARAGQHVCLLERGKEFQPGEYPNTEIEALQELQVDLPDVRHTGSRTGLYDVRVNKDINVVIGCGLGGTSLINANVSARAEPRVFEDPLWPEAFRRDLETRLEEGYRRAEEMLKPVPYPGDFPPLPKLVAHERSAKTMNERFYRPPINVTFQTGLNHVGVHQEACRLCGDCVSGCNYAAKNTTLMNYLPDAKNHGAEMYTQVSVRRLERKNNQWLVHYQFLDSGREKFDAPTMFIGADIIILAAGTLGSTEILLRSKAAGVPLSDRVGHHFTGNGDVLGFGYNGDTVINAVGFGETQPSEPDPVGPCITGIIDIRNQPKLQEGMVIEEGVIPGALAGILPMSLAGAAKLVGRDTDEGMVDSVTEKARELDSLLRGAYHGAVRHSQTYLVMSHDDSAGRMHLEHDRLRIDWPGVGTQPTFGKANERLEQATAALGGTYVKNPLWSQLTNHKLATVHPLGGCIMAEQADQGVVNHKGQVFSSERGREVYENVYVCDGSVIPVSLGINPLLTISAVAERSCALLAQDHGWVIDYELPSAPKAAGAPKRIGLHFTETMRGYFSAGIMDDYTQAEKRARATQSTFQFTLTIIFDDLDRMLRDENHEGKMVGSVTAKALSPNPLTVTDGVFNLFIADAEQVGTRKMVYRMKMTAEDGKRYFFDGFKFIHNDPGFDMWADTTTLYITVHDGDSPEWPVLGKGVLRILPEDFLRQLTTLQITNSDNLKQRMLATTRFGRFFAGQLYETYFKLFSMSTAFNPRAPLQ